MDVSGLDSLEASVDRITSVQQGLFAYILTLVPNVADAKDVLQETNLVLWRKREEFRDDAAYWPWARAIAHYQVLAHVKRRSRDRLRFGEALLARLAEEAVAHEAQPPDVEQAALDRCIEELPPAKRELVELRYSSGLAIAEIAERTGQSPGAVSDALYRIRGQLAECVQDKLRTGKQDK